jgi:hypothetical protein
MLIRLFRSTAAGFLVGLTLLAGPVLADCKQNYDGAVGLIQAAQKRIANNEHPSKDAFSTDFKAAVDKLQAEKCMPELMSLFQYIRTEQKKYPTAEGQGKPAPIVD